MYEEMRAVAVPGAVLWRAGGGGGVVLPDGCMDLLWADGRLLVAGPDTRPHRAGEVPGALIAGIRLAPGTAPALLGVPAHVLRDRRAPLADLWSARRADLLAGRVARHADPRTGLEELAAALAAEAGPPDPLAAEVTARLRAGATVADIARATGLGPRRLYRRSLDAFGYGPRTLGRVLRLHRALALARSGMPYAEVAWAAGYADQPHLAREVRALAGTTLSACTADYASGPASVPASGPVSAGAKSETPQPSGSSTTA